jgi:hypothetical protein
MRLCTKSLPCTRFLCAVPSGICVNGRCQSRFYSACSRTQGRLELRCFSSRIASELSRIRRRKSPIHVWLDSAGLPAQGRCGVGRERTRDMGGLAFHCKRKALTSSTVLAFQWPQSALRSGRRENRSLFTLCERRRRKPNRYGKNRVDCMLTDREKQKPITRTRCSDD